MVFKAIATVAYGASLQARDRLWRGPLAQLDCKSNIIKSHPESIRDASK